MPPYLVQTQEMWHLDTELDNIATYSDTFTRPDVKWEEEQCVAKHKIQWCSHLSVISNAFSVYFLSSAPYKLKQASQPLLALPGHGPVVLRV